MARGATVSKTEQDRDESFRTHMTLTSRHGTCFASSRSNRRTTTAAGEWGGLSRFCATHYFSSSPSMATFARLSLFLFLLLGIVSASRFETVRSSLPHRPSRSKRVSRRSCKAPSNTDISACFPALGFTTPSSVPASTNGWWCDPVNEYAFLGFSYEVTHCEYPYSFFFSFINSFIFLFLGQSLSQLQKDFANIRNTFHGRYVRLYGACDKEGF